MIPPYGQGNGFTQALAEVLQYRGGEANRIQPAHGGQAQFQGETAQVIAAAGLVLLDQAHANEADQVAVGLGGGHAGSFGQVP